MLPAAQINRLPLVQLLRLKEAVDAASEQWERDRAERRRHKADLSAVARRAKEEAHGRQEYDAPPFANLSTSQIYLQVNIRRLQEGHRKTDLRAFLKRTCGNRNHPLLCHLLR